MTFEDLGLSEPLLQAIRDMRYSHPTPIQTLAIPPALAGNDVLGCAQTGTGKTAAFALPILHRLSQATAAASGPRKLRALVLAPTRELAAQIGECFGTLARHGGRRHAVIFGGVGQGPQCDALRRGVDVLVATPGRLLDLLGQRVLTLQDVEILVLDEADRMLDMGFIHDIRRILAMIPARRQSMLFSATLPTSIMGLAEDILQEPARVSVAPEAPAAQTVQQAVYLVDKPQKQALLQHLLTTQEVRRAIVFARTKHGADRIAKRLARAGISADALHSDKSQNARLRAMAAFRNGQTLVLVASDIAARGIDVADISHVFNYDMPGEAETYVHRIGRTGRAGAAGQAVSFCDQDEREALRDIEKLLGKRLPVVPFDLPEEAPVPASRPVTSGPTAANASRASSRQRSSGEGVTDGTSRSARRRRRRRSRGQGELLAAGR